MTTASGNSVTVPQSSANAGTFTYNLVSVQDASSTSCSQNQTGTAIVTVNPKPTAAIAGTTAICVGATSPNITFTGANGTAPYTFTYNISGGTNTTVTTNSGNSVTVPQSNATAGTFTYNLVSVQDASSTSCSQNQTGTTIVTVNPLPTATIAGTNGICVGATSPNITFTGANGTAPYTFTYNIGSASNTTVTTTNGNSVTVSQSSANAGTFTYNLVSVQDASSTSCSQSQTGTTVITVKANPVVSFTPDITSGCIPLTVKFTNNSFPLSEEVTWDFGDGETNTSTEITNEITHKYTKADCFDIRLTVTTNGCSASLQKDDLICTYPKPIASFTMNKETISILTPMLNIINTSIDANSYYWSFGDGMDSDLKNPTHEYPPFKGNFDVTLIVSNKDGCVDTTTQQITIYEEIIFYIPNSFTPDEDQYNQVFTPIFNAGYDPQNFTMYIFDRWGEMIFETHDSTIGWTGLYGKEEKIKCQDGLYIWKISYKETKTDKSKTIVGEVILIK